MQKGKTAKRSFFNTRTIVILAVFTALSYVLYMFVKFPLPFMFPSFLDLQISDMPALLAGFMLGPTYGIVVIFLKCLLKLPFSSTAGVGELADILIGVAFVLPSALIYKRSRTKKSAVIGLIIGTLSSTAVAVLANRFMLIPFYVTVSFGGDWDILLNMMRTLFKNITAENFYSYYLPLSVIPFNLIRGMLSALLTFLTYKSLAQVFKRVVLDDEKMLDKEKSSL